MSRVPQSLLACCLPPQNVALLEEEADINQLTEFFSYEHFCVIYCKFWELDTDHDLFIDAQDLARHSDHGEWGHGEGRAVRCRPGDGGRTVPGVTVRRCSPRGRRATVAG